MPVGLPLAGEIFAVSTTVCPKVEGLVVEANEVVVLTGFIVSVKALEVLAARLLSPE